MKVQIRIKEINPDFSQEYADEYQDGKESESNLKHKWASGCELKDAKSVELIEDGIYQLKCKDKDGKDVNLPIPNVSILRCHLEDFTDIDFAVSKSILNKFHQVRNEKYKTTRCYFYVNSEPESLSLGNLVINLEEMPEGLGIVKE